MIKSEKILTEKKMKSIKKNENFIKDEELFFEYAKNPSNMKLRNNLLLKNQALVVYIVNKYYSMKKEHKEKREDLLQEGMLGLLSAIDGFKPELGFKFSTYACVPLTTEILTRRGWKKYDELIESDETIGYNNGRSEWTKINGIKKYDNAPLVKFGDNKWNAICTDQHKWLISENNVVNLRPLTEWPESKDYKSRKKIKIEGKRIKQKTELITSATFIGGENKLTCDEAALLAWIFSNGILIGNRKNPTGALVTDITTKLTEKIKNLLIRLEALSDDKHAERSTFNIKTSVFEKIWKKSELNEKTISELVLEMQPDVRKTWFDTWCMLSRAKNKKTIIQIKDETLDALALCAFLEGKQGVKRGNKNECSNISWLEKPRNPKKCIVKPHGHGSVWCPNTELGSWTARTEEGHIFLTGNTWWVRQAINNYILNVEPIIHIPSHIRTAHNKLTKKLKEENIALKEMIEEYNKQEIKTDFEISEKMLFSINSAINSRNLIALDSPITSSNSTKEGNVNIIDVLESDLESESQEIKADREFDCSILLNAIKTAFKTLTEKEKYILLLRFDVIDDIPNSEEEIEKIIKEERMIQNG